MTGFENRLIKNSKASKQAKPFETSKPLKGEELAKYFDVHREDFQGNGDALCVEAGYGEYSEDGRPNCNFQPFVKELGKVMDLENEEDTTSQPQHEA